MFWTLEYRLRRTKEAAAYHAGKAAALSELINVDTHTSFERDALVAARAKQCSCEERVRQLREQIAARES